MPKCDNCKKSITKKAPGLECSKCSLIVHGSTQCAGLTSKQLAALRGAENLEWTCNECHQNSSHRKSFVLPEEDLEDENELDDSALKTNIRNVASIDVKKLLQDIAVDVDKCIKKQLSELQLSVDYCSNKVDEFDDNVEAMKNKIKTLEKKNENLTNTNKYLETKIAALEQRFTELEQNQLSSDLEIAGVPYKEQENPKEIMTTLANKLKLDSSGIKSVRRLPKKGEKTAGTLYVKLREECDPISWVQAARTIKPIVSDIISTTPSDETAATKVFVRHALTSYTKALLYQVKQKLKETFKFIWCNYEGKVLVRKDEKSKTLIIRSEADIQKLA